jgi:aminoglycoside 3-N-acetyltransferase
MANTILFNSKNGQVTSTSLRESLLKVGAHESEILYIHSGLTFGSPSQELTRTQLLEGITEVLLNLGVRTVCMPTFTFSFCNGHEFNKQNSKSQMGALNEYFRKRIDVDRSIDPLMSVALFGEGRDLINELGIESIGKDSTYDKLSRKNDVKFLFLGVNIGDCFTYMHYLEWLAKVPYRYNREFTGEVIDLNNRKIVTSALYVRYNGVYPNSASHIYGQLLHNEGILKREILGDTSISCVPLPQAQELYLNLISKDPNYFITKPFDKNTVNQEFKVKNMVAL